MRRLQPALLLPCLMSWGAHAAELRFIGLESISEADVRRLIGGRFEYIEAQPASRSRAADSAFMVEQLFRRNGFNDATVSWKVLPSDVIRLRINEGPRESLGEVRVEGIDDPELQARLESLFGLPSSKRGIAMDSGLPFREADVEDGLELIKAELQSQGYWEPSASVRKRETIQETGAINFTVAVEQGRLFRIGEPNYEGSVADGVRSAAEDFRNQPADTANINALRLKVTEYYRSRGFVDAKVRMSMEVGDGLVRPMFEVIEGKRYRLGEVNFVGLEKTKANRIRRRIDPFRGEYLDGNLVDQRIKQLIGTGAFSSLTIETTEAGEERLDATLRFKEAKAKGITLTSGFGDFEGFIVGARYYDRNFRGNLWNFAAGFELTQRSLLGEISLTDPWLFGTETAGRVRLYSLSRNYEGYDNWTAGLEGTLLRQINDYYSLEASVGLAFATTTADGLPETSLGETQYLHPYLRVVQRIDHRDSPILPTKGWYFESPLVFGGALGEESSTYVRTGFQSGYFLSLGDVGRLAFGARADLLIPSSDSLPIDLRLFSGGPRSVRSFPERELGPRANGFPLGGQASWVTNVEFIRPLAGAINGVVFVDAGGLSPDWQDFGFNDIDIAAGLGVRFDLPIGPVRLEYGHNLTKDSGEPSGTFHFAIGSAF